MLSLHRIARGIGVVLAIAVLPAIVLAQQPEEAEEEDEEGPRIEAVTFIGNASLSTDELSRRIETRETRCRSVLLKPLCAFINLDAFIEKHFLDEAELPADELRLRIHYFQRGWRRASVTSEVRPEGEGVEVIFRIEEGPPTVLESVSIRQTRPVLSEKDIEWTQPPRQGETLDLLKLTATLVGLNGELGEQGYLDAQVHDSATIGDDGLRADLTLVIDPGARSTLDTLDIRGNEEVTDGTIATALRLRRGSVLRSNDVVASERSLYESNLFHEARVEVPPQPDSAKRLEIEVREAPPRAGRVGAGFNTAEYLQAEGRFTHYDWLGGGRRLDARLAVGNLLAGQLEGRAIFGDVVPDGVPVGDVDPFLKPTWQASVELLQPGFRSAANAVGISVFTHRRTIPGIVVDRGVGGELSLTRRFDYRTPATVSWRLEGTSVEAGDLYYCVNYAICAAEVMDALRAWNRLSPLSAGYFSDRSDDPLEPTMGWRLRVDVEHASNLTLSDFGYHRVSGETTRYIALEPTRRRVIAARLRAGWVHPLEGTAERIGVGVPPGDEALLHPRKRFYAGGSQSVRGYRENQLGPRILTIDPAVLLGEEVGCMRAELIAATCDPNAAPVGDFLPRPTGGTSVIEGNVEYRFPLFGSAQAVAFVDGAIVGTSVRDLFSEGVSAITPGMGVRFGSPVGPIRIDVGLRPDRTEALPVYTEYAGDDGIPRLVRLETPRRYDPLEESGTLGSWLRRMTLHLSIGEAF